MVSLKQLTGNHTLVCSNSSTIFYYVPIIFPKIVSQQRNIDVFYLIIKLFIERLKKKKRENYVAGIFEEPLSKMNLVSAIEQCSGINRVYPGYLQPKGLKAILKIELMVNYQFKEVIYSNILWT